MLQQLWASHPCTELSHNPHVAKALWEDLRGPRQVLRAHRWMGKKGKGLKPQKAQLVSTSLLRASRRDLDRLLLTLAPASCLQLLVGTLLSKPSLCQVNGDSQLTPPSPLREDPCRHLSKRYKSWKRLNDSLENAVRHRKARTEPNSPS